MATKNSKRQSGANKARLKSTSLRLRAIGMHPISQMMPVGHRPTVLGGLHSHSGRRKKF